MGGDEPRPEPPARGAVRDRNEIGDRSGPRGRDEVPAAPLSPVERGRGPVPEPGPRFDAPPRGDVPRPPAPAPQAPAFERERDRDRERDAVPPPPRGPQRPPAPAGAPGFSRGDVPPGHAAGVGVRPMPPMPPVERGADAGPPGRRAMPEPTERVPRFERPDGPSAPPGLRAMPPDAMRAPMASPASPALPAFSRERVQPVVPGGREGRGPVPDDAQAPRAQPPAFDSRAVAR
jgi:hypothetical protein